MTAILATIGGFALLLLGAEVLVRAAAALALRLGLPPLVVGLTVVSLGTSSPELVVSLRAALAGDGAIAAGNVVGSNICNIGLILGLSALIRPLRVELGVVRRDLPVMLAAAGLLAWFLADGRLGRPEGAALAAGLVLYLVLLVRNGRRVAGAPAAPDAAAGGPATGARWRRRPGPLLALLCLAGIGLLALGADLFVAGATAAATRLGVGEAVIGLTLVAVGTSLPELATSTVAAYRRQGDVAVGNVVGSNIFNALGIPGAAALARPLTAPGVTWRDLGTMLLLSVLCLPLMRSGRVLSRREGALLLALYLAYLAWLLPR